MTNKLKPCPFCGGKVKKVGCVGIFYIACTRCYARGSENETKQKAIADWNRRAGGEK